MKTLGFDRVVLWHFSVTGVLWLSGAVHLRVVVCTLMRSKLQCATLANGCGAHCYLYSDVGNTYTTYKTYNPSNPNLLPNNATHVWYILYISYVWCVPSLTKSNPRVG